MYRNCNILELILTILFLKLIVYFYMMRKHELIMRTENMIRKDYSKKIIIKTISFRYT